MTGITEQLRRYMGANLDISEHLGLLHGLALDHRVKTIVEFGFRTGISATALACPGKPVISIDPDPGCRPHAAKLKRMKHKFSWLQQSSLALKIPECELLHIDSLHTYTQLKQELSLHHDRVSLWIAIHDTKTFGVKGKDGRKPGLIEAIREFLTNEGKSWKIMLQLNNNNGMTILERSTPP